MFFLCSFAQSCNIIHSQTSKNHNFINIMYFTRVPFQNSTQNLRLETNISFYKQFSVLRKLSNIVRLRNSHPLKESHKLLSNILHLKPTFKNESLSISTIGHTAKYHPHKGIKQHMNYP